ncbi:DUF2442 domain-containing protein [Synechocystis salina LEGE 06155]|jgi:hypothetical protein|nr:DUF2442 domain-containing protein [Synechocystis salina LEGE 06155]
MTPDVVQVRALLDYKLQIQFANGELKIFDMKPYLAYPAFSDLCHDNLFLSARVDNGTVAWTDEIDISPDTLYLKGKPLSSQVYCNLNSDRVI